MIPLYYQRDRDGLPRGWIKRMKRTIRTLGWRFNADRMVMDYTPEVLRPAAGNTSATCDPIRNQSLRKRTDSTRVGAYEISLMWLNVIGWTATVVFDFLFQAGIYPALDPGRGCFVVDNLRCGDPFGPGRGRKPHRRNRSHLHLAALGIQQGHGNRRLTPLVRAASSA